MLVWIVSNQGMLARSLIRLCIEKKINFISSSKIEADVTDLESLLNFSKDKNFTHIVNCSAYTNVDLAEKEISKAFDLNII